MPLDGVLLLSFGGFFVFFCGFVAATSQLTLKLKLADADLFVGFVEENIVDARSVFKVDQVVAKLQVVLVAHCLKTSGRAFVLFCFPPDFYTHQNKTGGSVVGCRFDDFRCPVSRSKIPFALQMKIEQEKNKAPSYARNNNLTFDEPLLVSVISLLTAKQLYIFIRKDIYIFSEMIFFSFKKLFRIHDSSLFISTEHVL